MLQPPSGHVFRADRVRGPVWYAKYRLPDGRQVQKKIGPAWTGRGRPSGGFFTKRTAEDWLRRVLDEARRGTLPGMVQTGATVADAAAEWLRYSEHERACKPSTMTDYRLTARRLTRDLGEMRLEEVTPDVLERWKQTLSGSNRTVTKYLVVLNGIFKRAMRVWGLPLNPVASVERPRYRVADDLDAFSPEEVWSLVRAAGSEKDAALFLTAAFTGLRMGELLALQWGDVDFAGEVIRVRRSYTAHGGLGTPKSGKVRSVPLVAEVARSLANLSHRGQRTGEHDLVFPGELALFQDAAALRVRYKNALSRARLRPLRFHDLRHTFGTLAVRRAEVPAVQAWMGHSDIQTTMRYVHHRDRGGEAKLLAEAFAVEAPETAKPAGL
ncbi:MAG TPA: tyrosine-type recombinase/integrase [Solirubrobacteraceae bacterium]|nr:tyrosine-type recombinase/integrase [Solirubrobacteraceae bacterium]